MACRRPCQCTRCTVPHAICLLIVHRLLHPLGDRGYAPSQVRTPSQSSPARLRRPTRRLASWALVLATVVSIGAAADTPIEDLARFPQSQVTVETAAGTQSTYRVWVADTEERQRQGLMFVRDLPAEQGMLFIHPAPRPSAFWMKNTYIPLDILFIDSRGKVVKVYERTTPLSLEPLGVDSPVRAVLELRGGESARRGIRSGDRVRHPAFR